MARKKAEPKTDPVTPEPEEQQPEVKRLGGYPLAEGHYFYPHVVSPRGHSGSLPTDRPAIQAIQRVVGAPETGEFDGVTAEAVTTWRNAHGLPASPLVDAEAWALMDSEG